MKEIRKLTLFLGDVAMLYASLALTLVIRYPMADLELHLKNHLYPFSAIFILWLAVFYLSELYQYKNYGSASMLVKRLAGAVFLSGVSSVIIFYLFGNFFELTPKINLLIFFGHLSRSRLFIEDTHCESVHGRCRQNNGSRRRSAFEGD